MFLECDSYVWHLGNRSIPSRIVLDGGSDWMVLPRKFVSYITFSEENLLNKLKHFFELSLLPVEVRVFFISILYYCFNFLLLT